MMGMPPQMNVGGQNIMQPAAGGMRMSGNGAMMPTSGAGGGGGMGTYQQQQARRVN